MTREEWNDRYARRVVEVACFSEGLAYAVALADDSAWKRGDPPEDAADEEMSNWDNDGD